MILVFFYLYFCIVLFSLGFKIYSKGYCYNSYYLGLLPIICSSNFIIFFRWVPIIWNVTKTCKFTELNIHLTSLPLGLCTVVPYPLIPLNKLEFFFRFDALPFMFVIVNCLCLPFHFFTPSVPLFILEGSESA